jgi:hypothetical protein
MMRGDNSVTVGATNGVSPYKSADEPISRILFGALLCSRRTATIIPLGRTSRYGSSNLPEGSRPDRLAPIAAERVPLRKR